MKLAPHAYVCHDPMRGHAVTLDASDLDIDRPETAFERFAEQIEVGIDELSERLEIITQEHIGVLRDALNLWRDLDTLKTNIQSPLDLSHYEEVEEMFYEGLSELGPFETPSQHVTPDDIPAFGGDS